MKVVEWDRKENISKILILTMMKKNDKMFFVILAGELAVPCIYNPL